LKYGVLSSETAFFGIHKNKVKSSEELVTKCNIDPYTKPIQRQLY